MAWSSELNKLMIDHTVIFQTTGGFAAHLNTDERCHRTINDMIQCQIYTTGLVESFWCYALQHTTFLRQWIAIYPAKENPYEVWHGSKPDFRKLHIFGCTLYLHLNETKSLGACSEPFVWLGYGPSTAVLLYWNHLTNEFNRCHHGRLDDLVFPVESAPGNKMIDKYVKGEPASLANQSFNLERVYTPFLPCNSFTYQVRIPPSEPLGLTWKMTPIK